MGSTVFGQSKKELKADVTKLKMELAEQDKLKAELAELKKAKEVNLENEHQKASYGLGVLVGNNLKSQGGDSLSLEAIIVGLTDVFKGQPLKMEMEACGMAVQEYMQKAADKKFEAAKLEGQAYLEKNKTNEGVKVTPSGLQYKVLASGKGKSPKASDNVTVHYTGKLTDGTVFDSSVERGEPATFGVGQVIPGWTEALQLMKEGDKFEFVIPSELAYGEQGAGQQIPPFSTLIFEVELLKVN